MIGEEIINKILNELELKFHCHQSDNDDEIILEQATPITKLIREYQRSTDQYSSMKLLIAFQVTRKDIMTLQNLCK